MKRKLCMLFILLACLCSINGFAQKAALTIKESDNGKTFTVKKQQAFDVLFKKECVGCQYVWTTTIMDTTYIKSVSSTYSNKSCKNCTGGNQDHTFHLKAKKAGTTQLAFAMGDKNLAVTIKVK